MCAVESESGLSNPARPPGPCHKGSSPGTVKSGPFTNSLRAGNRGVCVVPAPNAPLTSGSIGYNLPRNEGSGIAMANRHNLSSATPTHAHSSFHVVIVVCGVFTFSYLAARLGGALVLHPEMIWPLWPGCAFLVAVLLQMPRKVWPAVLVAGLAGFALYDVQEALPIRAIALLLVADTVEILIATLGVTYAFGGVPRLNSVKSLLKYSLFAVILAPVSVASVATSALEGDS